MQLLHNNSYLKGKWNYYIITQYLKQACINYIITQYKYPTTLHRSSFDVFNILAIFSHGISFEKT